MWFDCLNLIIVIVSTGGPVSIEGEAMQVNPPTGELAVTFPSFDGKLDNDIRECTNFIGSYFKIFHRTSHWS